MTEEIHAEYRDEQEFTCEGCGATIASKDVGCQVEDPGSEMAGGRQFPVVTVVVFCDGCHEDVRCDCD
ncbi:hypothetical protein [Streptomyces sp. CA-106131]|uniref:hypothetical protein n=1 Tax=Streptomyces sp. CA-106131 TaxID=3240045 RepID=UPI003D8DB6D6